VSARVVKTRRKHVSAMVLGGATTIQGGVLLLFKETFLSSFKGFIELVNVFLPFLETDLGLNSRISSIVMRASLWV